MESRNAHGSPYNIVSKGGPGRVGGFPLKSSCSLSEKVTARGCSHIPEITPKDRKWPGSPVHDPEGGSPLPLSWEGGDALGL